LFNGGAREGSRLFVGNEALYFIHEDEAPSFLRRAEGNMTGYTLGLRLDLFSPREGL